MTETGIKGVNSYFDGNDILYIYISIYTLQIVHLSRGYSRNRKRKSAGTALGAEGTHLGCERKTKLNKQTTKHHQRRKYIDCQKDVTGFPPRPA